MVYSSLTYKLGLLSCLYFCQGVPFGFVSQALPAMLRDYGVSLDKIGLISLVALPWALKFLWAPYVDHYGHDRLGKRKSWLIPLQLLAVACLLGMACLNPESLQGSDLIWLVILLLLANMVAATQDIATDGLAVASLPPRHRGLANGIQVGGYRVGMLFGGGVVLVLLHHLGWTLAFVALAAILLLASVPVWFYREPAIREHSEEIAVPQRFRSITGILKQFVLQPGMWGWVFVLTFYKLGDAFGSAMGKPLLVDLGLSLEQVGWISGGAGMVAGISGALLGGWLVMHLGRVKCLVSFGILQAVSQLGYWWLAVTPSNLELTILITAGEHFFGGMATAALFTLMMDACRRPLAGTDYTIQASVQVIVVGIMNSASGFSAQWLGYDGHFMLAFLLGMVALLPVVFWLKQVPELQRKAWHLSRIPT